MKKILFIVLTIFANTLMFAQEKAAETKAVEIIKISIAERIGVSETTLFLIMMSVTLILIITLVVMISSLKGVLGFKIKQGSNNLKTLLALLAIGGSQFLFGQSAEVAPVVESRPLIPFSDDAFWMVLLFDGILVGLIVYISKTMNSFLVEYKSPVTKKAKKWNWSKSLNDAVAIEEEHKIDMGHEYDGIRELDNNLPPWWKYSFYISIVWAVIYFGYYHVLGLGDLQTAEYNNEVQMAKEKYKVSLDENTVTLLVDEASLAGGKAIFESKCAICHRADGGGDIGPNLTDKYWIYGGDIKDLFRTVKFGASNGMQAWASELAPEKIQKVTSYILSLQGSNPVDPKPSEGKLYGSSEGEAVETPAVEGNDSSSVIVDTLIVEDKK